MAAVNLSSGTTVTVEEGMQEIREQMEGDEFISATANGNVVEIRSSAVVAVAESDADA